MGLNEPKRTKKTLNIFKMILYELKIDLNELKWALTRLIKLLPVMHISVRHDIFYNFSSDVINVKNKEKNRFLLPIFIRILGHALRFTPQVLRQVKGLIELYNSRRQQFWF